MPTPARALYERQLELLAKQDVDALVDEQYTADAEIISFDFVRRGEAEIRPHFEAYLANLVSLEVISTDQFAETDDTVFFEATVRTGAYGVVRVYDAWVLKDGRIHRHFTGRLG